MALTVNLHDIAAWLGGGTVVVAALGYGVNLVIERWLRRRDERQKDERQAELESHKAELARRYFVTLLAPLLARSAGSTRFSEPSFRYRLDT